MIIYPAQMDLPSGYTQVEYLGSDSQAYIDTGIAGGKDTLTVECKFMYNAFVSYGAIYGNYISDSHNGIRYILADNENRTLANNNTICTTTGNTLLDCAISQIHTVISKHDTITLDGVTTSVTNIQTGTENTNNIALFNRSITNTNTSRNIGLNVYNFKIFDADTLVLNLIPCRRNSDNVLGMYDLVSNTFLTNVGTGNFIAGPVVTYELKERYIGDKEVERVYIGDNLITILKVGEPNAEFYYRKTGGIQSVGSGTAAIKEVRGKSIVWNQLVPASLIHATGTTTEEKVNIGKSSTGFFSCIGGHKYAAISSKTDITKVVIRDISAGVNNAQSANNGMAIISCSGNGSNTYLQLIGFTSNQSYDFYINLIDLTLMFGAGNEPSSVAEFEKMFPLDHYDYNAGEVIPFAGQNLVTTGFNQWDGVLINAYIDNDGKLSGNGSYRASQNFIPLIPNAQYYFRNPIASIRDIPLYLYDANKKFITNWASNVSYKHQNKVFTVPSNAYYCRFYYFISNIPDPNNVEVCVNISDADKNGTYEPYEKHTLPLDPSQWRDKQGNLVFPYGGMHGVGTTYDYAKVDADGYIRKVVRCFGQVDLGTLTWEIRTVSDTRFFAAAFPDANSTTTNNAICSKYILDHRAPNSMQDKSFNISYWTRNKAINILDSSYTDAATFKAAMNGVILYYSLTEPVEVELATPVYAKYLCDKDGTEEITPANGTAPYTTMANLHLVYPKK